MLIETVANGGSVSFMHPLSPEAADAFWRNSLASAERGERIVFGPLTAKTGRHRHAVARTAHSRIAEIADASQ